MSISATPMEAVRPIPLSNACRADASSSADARAGRPSATVTAPPSVSEAAVASAGLSPAGSTIAARYDAMMMLPRVAVPSTAPSS